MRIVFAVCLQLEDAERLEQVVHAIWFSCYSVNMFGIDYCFSEFGPRGCKQDECEGEDDTAESNHAECWCGH